MDQLHFLVAERLVKCWDLHDALACIPDLYKDEALKLINDRWFNHTYTDNEKGIIIFDETTPNAFYERWRKHTYDNYLGTDITREEFLLFLHTNNVIGETRNCIEPDVVMFQNTPSDILYIKDDTVHKCTASLYLSRQVLYTTPPIINTNNTVICTASSKNHRNSAFSNQRQVVSLLAVNMPQNNNELFFSSENICSNTVNALRKRIRNSNCIVFTHGLSDFSNHVLVAELAYFLLPTLCQIQRGDSFETAYVQVYAIDQASLSGCIASLHSQSVVAFDNSKTNRTFEKYFSRHFNSFANSKQQNSTNLKNVIQICTASDLQLSSSCMKYIRQDLIGAVLIKIAYLFQSQ